MTSTNMSTASHSRPVRLMRRMIIGFWLNKAIWALKAQSSLLNKRVVISTINNSKLLESSMNWGCCLHSVLDVWKCICILYQVIHWNLANYQSRENSSIGLKFSKRFDSIVTDAFVIFQSDKIILLPISRLQNLLHVEMGPRWIYWVRITVSTTCNIFVKYYNIICIMVCFNHFHLLLFSARITDSAELFYISYSFCDVDSKSTYLSRVHINIYDSLELQCI